MNNKYNYVVVTLNKKENVIPNQEYYLNSNPYNFLCNAYLKEVTKYSNPQVVSKIYHYVMTEEERQIHLKGIARILNNPNNTIKERKRYKLPYREFLFNERKKSIT